MENFSWKLRVLIKIPKVRSGFTKLFFFLFFFLFGLKNNVTPLRNHHVGLVKGKSHNNEINSKPVKEYPPNPVSFKMNNE